MANQSISIKRSELYERIWSTPKIKLAKEFGTSDVGLGKICKRHNIPKPGLGYWAKLEHGKPVKKIHLPESEDGDYEIIITAFERPEIKTQDSNSEKITQADLLIRKINSDQDSVAISASLDNAHKLILRAQRSLRNAPKDDLHILKPRTEKCLPIHVSSSSLDQALLIMDSLIKLLEQYELSINPENFHQIDVLGNPISFGLYESHDREERELTKKEKEEQERYSWRRTYPQYTYTPNGKLSLKFDESASPSGMRKTWTINNPQKIDTVFKRFLLTAIELSVHKETEARRMRRWEKERHEEQRRRYEISQKKADARKRVEGLENEISLWHKSQQIREYVSYIQNVALKRHGRIDEGSKLDLWMKWATRRADIIDPLVHVETEEWEVNLDRQQYYW